MDERIINFVRNLGVEYSRMVDKVLNNPIVLSELILLLRENGHLESVKDMISQNEPKDELVRDARRLGISHPYATSDLAIFINAFGLAPDPSFRQSFRQKVEEEKETAQLANLSPDELSTKLDGLILLLRRDPMKEFSKPLRVLLDNLTADERWDEIEKLYGHLRTYLPLEIRKLWIQPEFIAEIFEKAGHPKYDVQSTHRLIEEILSWTRSGIITPPSDEELQWFGNRLATVSDAELCCIWFMTMGEYLCLEPDMMSRQEKEEWLYGQYSDVVSGKGQPWKDGVTFDIDQIPILRETKATLLERALSFDWEMESANTTFGEIFVEFIDLLTGCVMWEHLQHKGLVPIYEEQETLGSHLNVYYEDEIATKGYAEVYADHLRHDLYGYQERDILQVLIDYLPLENLRLLVLALRIATAGMW